MEDGRMTGVAGTTGEQTAAAVIVACSTLKAEFSAGCRYALGIAGSIEASDHRTRDQKDYNDGSVVFAGLHLVLSPLDRSEESTLSLASLLGAG